MKKKMKVTKGILIGIACLWSSLSSVEASWAGLSNCCPCLDGCWEIGIEPLVWKPAVCNFHYGDIVSGFSPTGNGTIEHDALSVAPDYHWGFRLFGGYDSECSCMFATLSWNWLHTNDLKTASAAPDGLIISRIEIPFIGNTDFQSAVGKTRFRYNKVSLQLGRHLYCGNCGYLDGFLGLRWTYLRRQYLIDGTTFSAPDLTGTYFQKNRFWGLGLEVGLAGDYSIGCNWSIAGRVTGAALVGEQNSTSQRETPVTATVQTVVIELPNLTQVIPAVDARLGIRYGCDTKCASFYAELGWEIDYYWKLFVPIEGLTALGLVDPMQNAGFCGPYLTIEVCF